MKKKLVSLLSLILAVVMVFPVSVFADESGTITLYYNATTENGDKTYQIDASAFTGDQAITKWESTDENVVKVSADGLVTAVGDGSAYVSAYDATNTQQINQKFTCISRTLTGIAVDTTSKFETKYYSGDVFDPTGMVIKASYDNGDVDSVSTGYTYSPSGALNTSVEKIEISYKDGNVTKTCTQAIDVTELYVTGVQIINYEKNYTEGETIKDVTIKVTYNDDSTEEKDSGFTISNTNPLKTTDKSFTATYRGVTSDAVTITVTAKPAETEKPSTPSTSTVTYSYTIEMTDAPTKKSYKVGDKFEDAGMKVKVTRKETSSSGNSLETNYTSKVSGLTYTEYTIKSTDAGKDYIEFDVSFNADGGTHTAKLKVTGLTIGSAVDDTKIREITSVTLKEDEYPEGYEFTLADISKLKVKFLGSSSSTTIEDDEFASYTYLSSSYLKLEVYDTDGERKTYSTYRDTIRDDDIYTDDGDTVVNMALRYTYYTSSSGSAKTGEYEFTTEIGEADISYYYETKLITEYDDLEDALKFCNEQDEDISEDDFDISDVDEDEYLMLKLGKDFSISSSFEFTPENNIVIDLNGHDLDLYSDTFEFDEDEEYTITIKNTSETEAKLTYEDKDIELVLGEDDSVEFEYDKTLPGIYTVTVTFDSDEGTVTADPKLTTGKVEVGMGSTVTFTITPKSGYEIDTVKAANKSVLNDKDNYTVKTTGVATYTLKDVSKDTTFAVTFKEVKVEWDNPFRDVSENSSYYSAVEFVYENELFKGTSDNTFSPSSTMTRAMFVTVLGRLSGMDDSAAVRKYGYDSDFTDVSSSNGRITYAVPYIKWAVENGIVEGYGDGTFGPENEITHQQMYVMMYRYARFVENKTDSIDSTSLSMSDRSSVADWASDAVKYAQKNSYLVFTNTTKTRIDPTGDATRSELAMLLESFCETVLGWSGDKK